jgi:hypothetical protein
MPIFKTTSEILHNCYAIADCAELPLKEEWLSKNTPTFDDITIWEHIYSQPGNIGVYAAWSPFVEVYVITYDLFINAPYGVEIFNSSEEIVERLAEFNIKLPTSIIWV